MTMGFVDDDAIDGISILIGLLRYGELIPTFGRLVTVADVVALFFSAYAAAVSRSIPPPSKIQNP